MLKTSRISKINTVIARKMVVACTGPDGEPDLFFCKVVASQGKLLASKQYAAARKLAKQEDRGAPMVAFDCEEDMGGKQLQPLFTWSTASEIVI